MKILLLGKNGQVGWELQRTLAPLGEIVAPGRKELDLSEPDAIRSFVRSMKPDLVVNAAAYTAVDKAEEEPDLAMAINGIAPRIISEEATRCCAVLIHYSTDYVFDGKKSAPYTEQDKPKPINIYGKTKLAGENAIREVGCSYLILRTSWIYGLRGDNFLLTIQRLATERSELTIVNDQYGAPTWSRMIAEATAQMLVRLSLGDSSKIKGLYHLTAAGETTWFEFAEAILELDQENRKGQHGPLLKAIKTENYPTSAARPFYSVLDNSLVSEQFAVTMPGWREQLKLALNSRDGMN